MVGRALHLATVIGLLCWCLAGPVSAQENLDAGKSPSQLFNGNCSACHKSPRGLLKSVPAGSLPGFLRQHYTTGPDMAGVLSSYLISNGASDTRYMDKGSKDRKGGGKDARDTKPDSRSEAPPPVGAPSSGPLDGLSRLFRPRTAAPDQAAQQQGAAEHPDSPRGKSKGRRKHGKPAADDAAKPASAGDEPSSGARQDQQKADSKADNRTDAKLAAEPPKAGDAAAVRPDPVPQVTPAAPPSR